MNNFTKLSSAIVTSTIWQEDNATRIVWVTMLATADACGRVEGSIPGLAHIARVTVEECERALDRLMSPDPYSRTKEHEGRRVEEIDGGWRILNYAKYRERRDPEKRKEQTREAVRRHRQKKSVSQCKPNVSQCKPPKAQAEEEEEEDITPPTPPRGRRAVRGLLEGLPEEGREGPSPESLEEDQTQCGTGGGDHRGGRGLCQNTGMDERRRAVHPARQHVPQSAAMGG